MALLYSASLVPRGGKEEGDDVFGERDGRIELLSKNIETYYVSKYDIIYFIILYNRN